MTTTKEIVWREVFMQRPYEIETLYDILTHLASLTSRGPIIWEARGKGGEMRYLLGTMKNSVTRVQEVLKAHSSVQFGRSVTRENVTEVRKLKISKPVLSLNTEVTAAMIRASIAAMTNAKSNAECVLQIILGAPHTPATVSRNVSDPTATWLDVVLGNVHRASADQHKVMRDKAEQYSFESVMLICISVDHTSTRLNKIISSILT